MGKWTKEDILKDMQKVSTQVGDLTRESYRRHGKIPTSAIDKVFKNFSDAKALLGTQEFEQDILKTLKGKSNLDLEGLCDHLDASPKKIKATLDILKSKGFNIKLRNKAITIDNLPASEADKKRHFLDLKPINNCIEFAVVSDTHLGSHHECLDELKFFYKTASEDYGIKTFLHAGDLVCGTNMYFGQENEIKVWGADQQVNYCVENYPHIDGATTYYITGNHDLCYLRNAGKDIGIDIQHQRKDMKYLGQYVSNIKLGTVNVELHHIDKAPSYALSYPLQKTIENTQDHEKPDLLFCGHLHQKLWLELRGINAFLAGCFEQQSLWLKRKKLYPCIGGYIIKVGLDGNVIRSVTPTFIKCH